MIFKIFAKNFFCQYFSAKFKQLGINKNLNQNYQKKSNIIQQIKIYLTNHETSSKKLPHHHQTTNKSYKKDNNNNNDDEVIANATNGVAIGF